MDRVQSPWTVGRDNRYAWPTEPVLRKLSQLRPEDLGAVVSLGPGTNRSVEKVLPVHLLADTPPSAIAYRFTFKGDARARVEATVLAGARRVGHRDPNWEEQGSPFVVGWSPSPDDREGWYRLLLSGQFEDGRRLDKVVEFYHRPSGLASPVDR
jgi:hypothetical protein